MERGAEQSKAQREKQALRSIVEPGDMHWTQKFTDMEDYDRVFQRIKAVSNWQQDLEIVYLFLLMRSRKHVYFNEACFPEDSVIIPELAVDVPPPNTEGFSEQQRKLAILAHNFVTHPNKHQKRRAAYNQVYRQFNLTKNWKEKSLLADLYQKVQACEVKNKQLILEDGHNIKQGGNYSLRSKDPAKEIEEQIMQARKEGQIKTYSTLRYYLKSIHGVSSWWKEEKLVRQHKLMISEMRILGLKHQGIWESKICGLSNDSMQVYSGDSTNKKGLLQRAWDAIWQNDTKR